MDSITDLLNRIITQTRYIRSLCTCGALGQIYADDEVTVLCAKCWLAIYGEGRDDANA